MSYLYIHIPFCKKKCKYCSFVSFEPTRKDFEQYFAALKKELDYRVHAPLKTIYIGGGTPSCVPVEYYEQFSFEFENDYEFTVEINPESANELFLKRLRSIGVNRLSIGVQSFDDEILQNIGRLHNSKEALDCIKLAQNCGFENISIDLIYGLPNQSLQNWHETLQKAVSLGIQHISTYGLKIEEGTYFGQHSPANLPDEDTCAQMYIDSVKILEKNGYKQYEISNFAQRGFDSQHNSNYWKNNDYIACGVAAHGYIDNVRYENNSNFYEYLKNPLTPSTTRIISEKDKIEEAIFLGLRLKRGIDFQEFKNRYNIDFEERYAFQLKKHADFFERTASSLNFTIQGMMLSNSILVDFID